MIGPLSLAHEPIARTPRCGQRREWRRTACHFASDHPPPFWNPPCVTAKFPAGARRSRLPLPPRPFIEDGGSQPLTRELPAATYATTIPLQHLLASLRQHDEGRPRRSCQRAERRGDHTGWLCPAPWRGRAGKPKRTAPARSSPQRGSASCHRGRAQTALRSSPQLVNRKDRSAPTNLSEATLRSWCDDPGQDHRSLRDQRIPDRIGDPT